MTEFIPRDIPIYCLVNHADDEEKEKAIRNRNEWVNRFGFTNFKFQESYNRHSQLLTFRKSFNVGFLFDYEFKMKPGNSNIMKSQSFRNLVDFYTLARKLRKLNGHSIIIQHNTMISQDIPISFLENDTNVFSIHNTYPDFISGMMCSPKFWHRSIEFFRKRSSFQNIRYDAIQQNYSNNRNLYEMLRPSWEPGATNFDMIAEKDDGYTTKL